MNKDYQKLLLKPDKDTSYVFKTIISNLSMFGIDWNFE